MRWLPLLLLIGCGRSWDLSQPFALSVDSPEIPAGRATAAFQVAIEQMGGTIRPNASQVVHVVYDAKCDCLSCDPFTAAHTEHGAQDTIQVCPMAVTTEAHDHPDNWIEDNIIHETAHVLGKWDHFACETGLMITPQYNCRKDHKEYQLADIAGICATGIAGGICERWRGGKQ